MQAKSTKPEYRADIDGLRAVAVLSVVGYHAFPGRVIGGFIGVDIFFVISGFLISSIVFSNLERKSFSFAEFYSRRIKRIFPALIAVLLAASAFGWFALLADEYKQLGAHVAGGAGFIANFVQWSEKGYFDNAVDTKPLLHLWSLGIEEQFYIVWPFLLAFVWKRQRSFIATTAIIAALSFAYSIWTISHDPASAFYSPISRFWELMVGGLLAYIALHKPHLAAGYPNIQSVLGLGFLALGLVFIDSARIFPGWWVLLPTIGTFFLISAGQDAWFNRHVLSNKILVWFGLISYPLYLWHWPLLTFARIELSTTPTRETRAGLVIASIILAWITYRFIERPIRSTNNKKARVFSLIALMTASGCLGYITHKHNGFPDYGFRAQGRQDFFNHFENGPPNWNYYTRAGLHDKNRDDCNFYDIAKYRAGRETHTPLANISDNCHTRDLSFPNAVFIWGDSHAAQLNFGLRGELPKTWQILQVTSSGCWPDVIPNRPSTTNYCTQSNWFALKTISEARPDVVIVAQNIFHNIARLNAIAEELRDLGVRRIIFTGPTPHWTSDLPRIIVRKFWDNIPQRTYVGIDKKVLTDDSRMKGEFVNNAHQIYASIIDVFCNRDGCLTYLGEDKIGGITSADYGHLTPAASVFLAKKLLVNLIVAGNAAPPGDRR